VILSLDVGDLREPLTGRVWPGATIPARCRQRAAYYRGHGLQASDRVFVHHGNTLEFFVDLLAIWSLGACAVPIDPRLTPFEVDVLARAALPRLSVWRGAPQEPTAANLVTLGVRVIETPEDQTSDDQAPGSAWPRGSLTLDQDALVLFTSGTTGRPKGVIHTHRSLRARWMSLRAHLDLRAFRRTLCLLPTHFGHGLICNALFPWLQGQDLFLLPPFRADLVPQLGALLDAHRITFLSSVPSLWRMVLKMARPPETRSLERVVCGSAPLSAVLWRAVQEWTGTPDVLNVYGITETGSWLAGGLEDDVVREDGLIGKPWGGVIAVTRDEAREGAHGPGRKCEAGEMGHIWVNTPALMRGYLGRDDLTAAAVSDGWFATGDTGFLDARGRLHLRGREREDINRGGTKVYPADVDAVVEGFDHVMDVSTFGYDDAVFGEEVAVAVVLRRREPEVLRGLEAWIRGHLAPFQWPRRWYVLDEIPRTSRGKVNRAELAARCAGLTPVDLGQAARDASEPRAGGVDHAEPP
jgi:acyl-CoA synthetase (AMP-forming)/AMP-acid ligase II